jgi:hypothetical protein
MLKCQSGGEASAYGSEPTLQLPVEVVDRTVEAGVSGPMAIEQPYGDVRS